MNRLVFITADRADPMLETEQLGLSYTNFPGDSSYTPTMSGRSCKVATFCVICQIRHDSMRMASVVRLSKLYMDRVSDAFSSQLDASGDVSFLLKWIKATLSSLDSRVVNFNTGEIILCSVTLVRYTDPDEGLQKGRESYTHYPNRPPHRILKPHNAFMLSPAIPRVGLQCINLTYQHR